MSKLSYSQRLKILLWAIGIAFALYFLLLSGALNPIFDLIIKYK